jgi:hypothetical protein
LWLIFAALKQGLNLEKSCQKNTIGCGKWASSAERMPSRSRSEKIPSTARNVQSHSPHAKSCYLPRSPTAPTAFMTDAVLSMEQVADYRVTRLADLAPILEGLSK